MTEEQLDDEHWDAATNSAMCYDVAIAALRVELLKERVRDFPSEVEDAA